MAKRKYDDETTDNNLVGIMLRNGLVAKGGVDRGSQLSAAQAATHHYTPPISL